MAAMASLPHSSFCGETPTGDSWAILFSLDPGFSDDLAPARMVFADRARELGGRVGLDHDALRGEPRLELGSIDDLGGFTMDSAHNLAGRFRRDKQPEPGIERVAGHAGLGHRRRIAQVRKARRR